MLKQIGYEEVIPNRIEDAKLSQFVNIKDIKINMESPSSTFFFKPYIVYMNDEKKYINKW